MRFDLFVLPFLSGLIFLLVYFGIRLCRWLFALEISERAKIRRVFGSKKLFAFLGELLLECLLHRRIFKQNKLLGYMHASLATGWFLLIVVGNIETKLYSHAAFNPPYFPIFLKFFIHHKPDAFLPSVFSFLMDFLLLFVLSGVALAWTKRFLSSLFGMRQTTRHHWADRWTMAALWAIFPLRFLAECITAGMYANGSLISISVGRMLSDVLPAPVLYYPLWSAYSLSLGVFFFCLPFSRYMHIPTEIFLIALRQAELKGERSEAVLADVEVKSCPSCGICINRCQMSTTSMGSSNASVYLLKNIRRELPIKDLADACMICGRCESACPVGIQTQKHRLSRRVDLQQGETFSYLPQKEEPAVELIYFSGCMSQLTPNIPKSIEKILDEAKVSYHYYDKEGAACCGRPMALAGQRTAAEQLMQKNKEAFVSSGAKILLTSCPICYYTFKNEYQLPMTVLHHSEYFLQLVEEGRIALSPSNQPLVYHDPCELGRKSQIYEQPRQLLGMVAQLQSGSENRETALCCGGSLGGMSLSSTAKNEISKAAYRSLTAQSPQVLVTACPLCKKTFSKFSTIPVKDLAEVLAEHLIRQENTSKQHQLLKHHVSLS